MPKNLNELMRLIVSGFILLFGITIVLTFTLASIIFILSH